VREMSSNRFRPSFLVWLVVGTLAALDIARNQFWSQPPQWVDTIGPFLGPTMAILVVLTFYLDRQLIKDRLSSQGQ
jgi:hypothetical protein